VLVATYVADFSYGRAGAIIVEDYKGVRTPVYRLKKRALSTALTSWRADCYQGKAVAPAARPCPTAQAPCSGGPITGLDKRTTKRTRAPRRVCTPPGTAHQATMGENPLRIWKVAHRECI